VQIDCLNVKRANDLAQLFGKEGHVQKGIKFKSMLTKARPVDEKILNERIHENLLHPTHLVLYVGGCYMLLVRVIQYSDRSTSRI
jgi:hypothetical protein